MQNLIELSSSKSWNEECAIVGCFNCDNASLLAYYSLFAMQHRGQEASGISSLSDSKITTIKDIGLVTKVFTLSRLQKLKGKSAIGHNRYATSGKSVDEGSGLEDAQPLYARYDLGEIALVHNGNLVNAKEIRNDLTNSGSIFQSNLDTEVIMHLIAKSKEFNLTNRIIQVIKTIKGAFSLIFLSRSKMFVTRDSHGLRPLSIGKLENKDGSSGYIIASETCAFDLIGATYIRDILAGELIVFEIGANGDTKLTSIKVLESENRPCVFEYIYFARPDSLVFNRSVYAVRKNLGKQLAIEHRVKADMVIPVPDSGVAAAIGYSEKSKVPFELGIIRNHYVGRTFIEPTQELRELKVRLKLNPVKEIINSKDVIIIDDSLVRGTTSKAIISLLKKAGAKKVHLLISAPPTISPCFYGVDTPCKEELINAYKSIEEVCEFIGADSLGFLSLDGLKKAIDLNEYNFCQACFDGKYFHDNLILN